MRDTDIGYEELNKERYEELLGIEKSFDYDDTLIIREYDEKKGYRTCIIESNLGLKKAVFGDLNRNLIEEKEYNPPIKNQPINPDMIDYAADLHDGIRR